MNHHETLSGFVGDIITRFDSLASVRDDAVTDARKLVRISANVIRALHRGEVTDDLITHADDLATSLRSRTRTFPSVYWAGYLQDAMKEHAEAHLTRAMLTGKPLPSPEDLGVEDAVWLNGLAEAASELRRDVLDALRLDNSADAEHLLHTMDTVYGVLVEIDFPDAVTNGLRRTTDQLRGVLERTRSDVTVALRQSRLERSIRALESRLESIND